MTTQPRTQCGCVAIERIKLVRLLKIHVPLDVKAIIATLTERNRMKLGLLTFVSAFGLAVLPATASIVVLNGNFETQSSGVAADWTVGNPPATDVLGDGVGGSYGEVFGPGKSQINEDIDLGPNPKGPNPLVTYEVTFYAMNLNHDPADPSATFSPDGQFGVKLDGQAEQLVTVTAGATITSYTKYTLSFQTTDVGERLLTFRWTGTADTGSVKKGTAMTPGEGFLDDVTVTAVPEPTTWVAGVLMILPFGMSSLRILRKSRMI